MLARLAGATVLVSDPMPERRAIGERLGASAAFDPKVGDLRDEFAPALKVAERTSFWLPFRCLRFSSKL